MRPQIPVAHSWKPATFLCRDITAKVVLTGAYVYRLVGK
jgi:hypothetical protein